MLQSQETVDGDGNETELIRRRRHDPCVLPRAVPIVEAMSALVLIDHRMIHTLSAHLFQLIKEITMQGHVHLIAGTLNHPEEKYLLSHPKPMNNPKVALSFQRNSILMTIQVSNGHGQTMSLKFRPQLIPTSMNSFYSYQIKLNFRFKLKLPSCY